MSKTWFTDSDSDPDDFADAPTDPGGGAPQKPAAPPASPPASAVRREPTFSTRPQLTSNGTPRSESWSDVPVAIPGYTLLSPIGRGGMGEVWLAERISEAGVGVRCALKIILPERETEHAYRAHFLNEARTSSLLRHPNVVTIFDVGQVAERLYMAMEWVDGVDLRDLIRRLRTLGAHLPMKHALYILRASAQGLHYAHTMKDLEGRHLKLVHRDISPENLLISREGAVKLSDFGVAWSAASGTTPRAVGKVHYFAPELLHGGAASVRSDLFALGVTFYEMLMMRPLFSRRNTMREVCAEVARFQPASLFERDLSVPEELEDILMRCLAVDPTERYSSALELLEDVNDFTYEAGIRLLDAHFAKYIARVLERPPP